ncbi:MAG: right-handed parallel beta-helix repeat-containing protein [Rhodocyclaceae bacterium]|nr:right-handed parallel beta-helix repeat-containing protein [Rhodocyclaceae bacterium]MBX3669126.1 right-handed parallel beta-helix repeat-containing protein [Rhodocyclaceae bacterium]
MTKLVFLPRGNPVQRDFMRPPLLIATILFPVAAAAAAPPCGADLCVGPAYSLQRPSDAARVARDGQTIAITAGTYAGDVAVWTQNGLTLRGVGGRAHMRADGRAAANKGIWVIKGNDTTVENIEFSGARVPDANGAGIRLDGLRLNVRYCYFHDNETGILTNDDPANEVLVEYSEFARSGGASRNPHGIYIGRIARFTLRASYLHHARVGHNLKSRAKTSYILYNRIMDEADGKSSYVLDLPDGGVAYVIGNLLEKGPNAETPTVVAYGEEGYKYADNALFFVHNTAVNDGLGASIFVHAAPGAQKVHLVNNLFIGRGDLPQIQMDGSNVRASHDILFQPAGYDYRPRAGTPAVAAGRDAGSGLGVDLNARWQYLHPTALAPRTESSKPDAGALQHAPPR